MPQSCDITFLAGPGGASRRSAMTPLPWELSRTSPAASLPHESHYKSGPDLARREAVSGT